MPGDRLSALDASFLEVESPTAHMHVGWASVFAPPAKGPLPRFPQLRDHIAGRLDRAPRYRQKLATVPLGLSSPVWVDDEEFDIARHVKHARSSRFGEVVDAAMSAPLDRERPLWEIWIADRLGDGSLGVVGKAHHCMVDGLAAVELAALLLDPTPDPPPAAPDPWRPVPRPGTPELLASGIRARAGAVLEATMLPARLALSPGRLAGLPRATLRGARAVVDAARPATPEAALNAPISPGRHLACRSRPLDDLRQVKRSFGTTVNDVLLAASAAGLRRYLRRLRKSPRRLKTMVPVSVRDGEGGGLGNRISFVFVDLPCDEPDPVRRLRDVHRAMSERKQAGEADGADGVLRALEYAPHPVQTALSRLVASPVAFNLTVSNIPGPREALYMRGCKLEEAYPVVPIADRHGVSIGMTTIGDSAFFGVYADRASVPEADTLAEGIDRAVQELVELAG